MYKPLFAVQVKLLNKCQLLLGDYRTCSMLLYEAELLKSNKDRSSKDKQPNLNNSTQEGE